MSAQARLTVDVVRLENVGERLTGNLDPAALDLGGGDGLSEPASDLGYDLRVERIGDELLVRGSVAMELDCACSRCAETFRLHIEEPAFVVAYSLSEEIDFVDLTPDLREAIILALPRFPVCRETCHGLCSRCGINLNRASCRCTSNGEDDRWDALDALAVEQKKRSGNPPASRRVGGDAGNSTNT